MADTENRVVEGYIIKYGSRSKPLSTLASGRQVYEQFAPGAFAESVDMINAGVAIKANVEHVKDNVMTALGATGKNITIEHRADGVFVRVNLLDDSISDDMLKRIKAGFANGASIEFKQLPGFEPSYSETDGGYIRTFAKAALSGFAIVDNPAYADAKLEFANDSSPVFSRSVSAAETIAIAEEVKKYAESLVQDGVNKRISYERWGWLHGIRTEYRNGGTT